VRTCSFTSCSSNADAGVLLQLKGDTVTLDACQLVGAANGQTGFTGAVEIFGVGSSVVTGCNVTQTLGANVGLLMLITLISEWLVNETWVVLARKCVQIEATPPSLLLALVLQPTTAL